ncbi:hypothetical protein [Coralloluteibacterium stylophorae]|uniref:Lipoprotein n=1 Tax=Coralloluteibacterium stylophorae TaxID=1776034 RepID=A0A8J7VTH6_9GAMM|nr:hypothetical protein [Coralloluteibacterium stylophorae]MBS7456648.1 hypothetical protein [Coralloluteibacterium stylophorae]
MKIMLAAAPPLILLLAGACSGSVGATSAGTEPVSMASPGAEHPAREGLQIECGGVHYRLDTRGADVRAMRGDGAVPAVLPRPEGMDLYVPVGMGCAAADNGDQYLVVEYGESPIGCKVCEWMFVYGSSGAPLNKSVPPHLGTGAELRPNNEEYDRLLGERGLEHPRIDYPGAPGRLLHRNTRKDEVESEL